MQKEKVRIYQLARELNMESKDLVDLCRSAGIDVKNQLSGLDPEQRDAVELLVRRGGSVALAEPLKPAVLQPPPQPVQMISTKVRSLDSPRPPRREQEPARTEQPAPAKAGVAAAAAPTANETAARLSEEKPLAVKPEAEPGPPPESPPARPAGGPDKAPPVGSEKVRDLSQPRGESGLRVRERKIPKSRSSVVLAKFLARKQTATEEKKKPTQEKVQQPIAPLPPEMIAGGGTPAKVAESLNKARKPPLDKNLVIDIDDEDGEVPRGGRHRPGSVAGRDARHHQRNLRARERKGRTNELARSGLLTVDEVERPVRIKDHVKKKVQKKQLGPTQPRKGKVPVTLPITVRSLSEAMGVPKGELLFRLSALLGQEKININSVVPADLAETIALERGCELEIKKPLDTEEKLLESMNQPDPPEALQPRAPIVTIMGHVDHGKTSLLDRIRQSNIVATEAGGITQVIRAWRVNHGGRPITFLDTPGHEAFTKMRARGAQVTDIAVIVVAADDGVMPQTEEAINHARAAGVSIVVAINKIDLPNANVNRTRQQLYSHQLIPDTMGGDTPFVETSAATGKGIFEEGGLLDMLSLVAELKELKANPNRPARGICLEAMLTEGEGVVATLLVQNGTLRQGDVILCGASYGRVRAMYDDLGRPIHEAGPSVPVRITGLGIVPNADDPFLVVPDLAMAREIAEKRLARQQEAALLRREPARLENLSQAHIAELKIILKADFRGSVEAIRKELEKLKHEEVRVRILHAAIGGITESDVHLALTSPEDTIIVGFNVVPDERARALAEERGVQIREYNIIYQLTDDIRAALEGKLKPIEEIVHLGRAVVRETFKVSRVGTIAGCYVTQGVIERSSKVRVIREGVVVYPPPDRTVGLESLRRFKEDVREVREGFECGLKVAGYDDIKVGDVIEAYRIEQIQRKLE